MRSAFASSKKPDADQAASELVDQLNGMHDQTPSALILFAGPSYDHERLLRNLSLNYPDCILVGSSSAGEFGDGAVGEGVVCLALGGDDVDFSFGLGTDIQGDVAGAAKQIASAFRGLSENRRPFRSALVLTDALAGHASSLVSELTLATKGQYSFFGGGAGDNAQFKRTSVFCGSQVLTNAAVALELLSDKPVGIGAMHGWEPASAPMRVTEAQGMSVISLDGLPAEEAFQRHATETKQSLNPHEPIPFFLHNIIGIRSGGGHLLRVPLAIQQDGAVLCAAEVPTGSVVHIMRSTTRSAVEAAQRATQAALSSLGNAKPEAGLFFDCVATRLRLGDDFGRELSAVKEALPSVVFTGCNTHGQIVRAEGQFDGFHNCTAVVCLFPA